MTVGYATVMTRVVSNVRYIFADEAQSLAFALQREAEELREIAANQDAEHQATFRVAADVKRRTADRIFALGVIAPHE